MADLGDLRDQTVAGQVTVRKLDNRGQTLDLSKLPFRHPKMFFAISGGRIEGPGNYNIGLSDFNLQEAVIGADLTFNERVFLDNVTLDDVTLTFTSGGSFQLVNELKGKGVIHMDETASFIYGSDATLPKDIRLILDNSQRVGLYRNLGTIQINRGNQVAVGINEGTIHVNAPKNSYVYLGADTNWANRGTIRQTSGNLEFFGNYDAAAIGNFIREGGELFYGGVYDNQDATLHLDNTTGFNGEILAGRIEVAPGQVAKAGGFVRGPSELSGTLRIYSETSRAELDIRRMKLDNGRIEIPRGDLYFESITGTGSLMVDGLGRIFARTEVWTMPSTMTLETGPEIGGGFSSTVVSEGTVRVRPGTELNMNQFANRHEVRVEQNGRLKVYQAIGDPSAPVGHWQIETNAQVEFYQDATLQPQDHWTYQIGTATNRPMIRGINSVNVAGGLEVVFAADYRARTDDAFRLLQATALSGKFSQLTLPDLPPSFQWNTSELESTGWLRVNGPAMTTTVLTAMVEPPLNANSFVPAAGQKELGFQSQFTNTGINPLVGVTADAAGKRLTHRSVTATTQFDSLDLSTTNFVELEVQLAIASTGYEEGDFVEVFAIHGGERVDIVNLRGTPLNNAAKNTVATYSAILPDTWADATLYFKSNSNSTGGSEAYHLYRASIAGYPLDSSSGDFDRNGTLDSADVDQLSRAIARGENSSGFDLNKDNLISQVDLAVWVSKFKHTTAGDANLDGAFNSADLIFIFQAGQYEDAIANNSGWATGDWNADLEFTSSDLLVAFQAGGYEEAVAGVRAIPEPALSSWIVLMGSLMLSTRVRRVRRPGDSVGRCGECKDGHRG